MTFIRKGPNRVGVSKGVLAVEGRFLIFNLCAEATGPI